MSAPTPPVRRRNRFLKVLLDGHDDGGCSRREECVPLRCLASDGHRYGSDLIGYLDRRESDSAGGGCDQDVVGGSHMCLLDQSTVCCGPRDP